MKRILIIYLFFIVAIGLPPIVASYQYPTLLIPGFWALFWFFCLLTLLVIVSVLLVQLRGKAETSAQTFLAATVIKLLLCMVTALLYILKFDVDKAHFILNFFYLYFLNTAFEIYALIRNLRHQNF